MPNQGPAIATFQNYSLGQNNVASVNITSGFGGFQSTVNLAPKYDDAAKVGPAERSLDKPYICMGTEDPQVVYKLCAYGLPANLAGLWLHSFALKHLGAGLWDVTAHYDLTIPIVPGTITLEGETTGETIHREQTLQTIAQYGIQLPGGGFPNYGGLIGVGKDGVKGVDVPTPGFGFTVKKRYDCTQIPSTFVMDCQALVGSVCNTPLMIQWKNQIFLFSVGEIQYLGTPFSDGGSIPATMEYGYQAAANQIQKTGNDSGATAQALAIQALVNNSVTLNQKNETILMSHKFKYSPNSPPVVIPKLGPPTGGLTVGPYTGIEKRGWDYLWTFNIDGQAGSSGFRTKIIQTVNVEQVLTYASWAGLMLDL